jgi:hypothetical protein
LFIRFTSILYINSVNNINTVNRLEGQGVSGIFGALFQGYTAKPALGLLVGVFKAGWADMEVLVAMKTVVTAFHRHKKPGTAIAGYFGFDFCLGLLAGTGGFPHH